QLGIPQLCPRRLRPHRLADCAVQRRQELLPARARLLQGPGRVGRQDPQHAAGPDRAAPEPAAQPAVRRACQGGRLPELGGCARRARRQDQPVPVGREYGQPAGPDDQRRDHPVPGLPRHANLHPERSHARKDGDLGAARTAASRGAGRARLTEAGQRWRIRRLKLSVFKIFVEPAELRIEAGLTGVVGPNGCGKSNLLETIRWTMGESSPKSLRGGGMDDVIFAGTSSRPPRDFAEVSILIERDPTEQDRGGESEVTRRIERGTGSAYRIDGRDVRAKDVALLFADAATGAHSPALVSQGKIA